MACEGWLCDPCAWVSDYNGYRGDDEARITTATIVSRQTQRRLGDGIAYEQMMAIVSLPSPGVLPAEYGYRGHREPTRYGVKSDSRRVQELRQMIRIGSSVGYNADGPNGPSTFKVRIGDLDERVREHHEKKRQLRRRRGRIASAATGSSEAAGSQASASAVTPGVVQGVMTIDGQHA